MNGERLPSCPACGARFRGTTDCSRCGADLHRLMLIATLAHARRVRARQLLLGGEPALALKEAHEAQALAATAAGEALVRVARCLRAVTGGRAAGATSG